MYRLHLSFQFLRHHWLMSLIGSFFVGMSLIILVVVMSVMDGFQQRLKNTISGSSAEYILVPRFPSDFERLAKAVEEQVPQIKVASPFHETVSFVQRSGPQDPIRDKLEFAKVSGIDGWREQSVNDFGKFIQGNDKPADVADPSVMRPPGTSQSTALVQGVRDIREPFKVYSELDERSGTKGVIIGWGLQRTLRVKVGEKIKIASIRRKVGTNPDSIESADFDIRWLRYIVVGTYLSGNGDTDAQCIFMDHKVVEELWSPDVRRSGVRAKLKDPSTYSDARFATERALSTLAAAALPPGVQAVNDPQASLNDWKDQNISLMQAIESEKSMILIIAFLIVIAGTSSIFAAQWLLVSDKVREIGIIRALGAGVEGVMSVFVLNGFLMGAIGSAAGVALGLLVVDHIDAVKALIGRITGRDIFPPDIYLFDSIPTKVDYGAVTSYAIAALVCTLIASAIPALRAGLMDPAKALHRD